MSSQPVPVAPYGYELRPRRVYPIETKPFFLTSEFVAAVLVIAGIAIRRPPLIRSARGARGS